MCSVSDLYFQTVVQGFERFLVRGNIELSEISACTDGSDTDSIQLSVTSYEISQPMKENLKTPRKRQTRYCLNF